MFRKIHSNRNPNDTVQREIRKEFGRYFDAIGKSSEKILIRRPGWSYAVMVFLLCISIGFSVWIYQNHKPLAPLRQTKVRPINDGFSQIYTAGEKIRAILKLKHEVDSISSRKKLNAADTLALDSALDGIQSIQKSLK